MPMASACLVGVRLPCPAVYSVVTAFSGAVLASACYS